MADMKEMSFMLLVILVSISAIYEWAGTDEVLKKQPGLTHITGFEGGTFLSDVNRFQIGTNELITNAAQAEIVGLLSSLLRFFADIWGIVMRMMFGWIGIVYGIFNSVGIPNISLVFIAPLAVLELLGALYFFRDIVNTVRGVG